MKLSSIELAEFRGWSGEQRVEFDPVVTIVQGPNGTGKTSLFDAVLWALTGSLRRMPEGHENDVVSRYGNSGLARVRAEFLDDAGSAVVVLRTTDGAKSTLSFEDSSGLIRGVEAQSALVRAFWPAGGAAETDSSAWARALTRSVYLQQDDVRRFVEADSDAERFDAVAELLGVGRVTDLQHQLERQRQQWTRVSNERRERLVVDRTRLSQIEARLAALSESTLVAPVDWASFRTDVLRFLPDVALAETPATASVAQQLDGIVRELEQRALAEARRADAARDAIARLHALNSFAQVDAAQVEAMRTELEQADRELAAARAELVAAQAEATEIRTRLLSEHNDAEELRTLAALALRHLGETCPVCNQTYDHEGTRARLTRAAGAEPGQTTNLGTGRVDVATSTVLEAERRRVDLGNALREIEGRLSERKALEREAGERIESLGLRSDGAPLETRLAEAEARSRTDEGQIRSVAATAQNAAVQAARLSERSLARDLEQSAASSQVAVQKELAAIEARERAGAVASDVIDALRAAADELVTRQVALMAPLLDRIYGRIDPHPSFRSLSLIARTWRGRGRLTTRISDDSNSIVSDSPGVLLSSSQMNAVALSVFLALNLGIGDPPLDLILLDDPLQSLDEINLLGVVDLLRRSKTGRQLVISTHDRRFATLLQRKLRPINANESLSIVRLGDWSRSGPHIQSARLTRVGDPWRIAKTAG